MIDENKHHPLEIKEISQQNTANKKMNNSVLDGRISNMSNFVDSEILNNFYQKQNFKNKKIQKETQESSILSSQNLEIGSTSMIGSQNKKIIKKSIESHAIMQGDQQAAHFNNKIIINQQHYFTDSIKIYQNQNVDTDQDY